MSLGNRVRGGPSADRDGSRAFLDAVGLTKSFGRTRAVVDASLRLDRGETLALLGPSGCGKTTLLRILAGFEMPDGGEVWLNGRTLVGGGAFVPPERRRVGLVFQEYALFPHMDVAANVGFSLSRERRRGSRVHDLLATVGLAGFEDRYPHELSGGQQQRVALARALAADPDLLLLDEPYSNLDPSLRSQVREEVRAILHSLGTTAIIVTHDQEEALSIADRVAVMLDGTVQQVGEPKEIYRQPASRAVAAFVGEANFLPGEVDDGSVRSELGRIPVSTSLRGPVQLMVRPEGLALAGPDGTPGECVDRTFYGHDQVLTVRLATGRTVRVRLGPSDDPVNGDEVFLRVRGDVLVFDAPA